MNPQQISNSLLSNKNKNKNNNTIFSKMVTPNSDFPNMPRWKIKNMAARPSWRAW